MIKVLTVFGTRPEAIKLAPVIKELERRPDRFDSRVCVTAQHRELMDQMLDLFGIRADHDFGVMTYDQSPSDVAAAVLSGLGRVLRAEEPDWVMVQGDTTTTMAGGIGAFYHGCRVAHVEAGLRTFDPRDPWPEEMNRRVAGVVADLHFAPTAASAANLRREGVPADKICVTGNTVIDALNLVSAMPFEESRTLLARIPIEGKRVVVVTIHRRETALGAISAICSGLIDVARQFEDVQIVCPVHPNPNVRRPVSVHLGGIPNIALVPPLDYRSMIWLLRRSEFVITDSGGLQEEATAIGKPVLVVRHKTERLEGVVAGIAKTVGTDRHAVSVWASNLLSDPLLYERMARVTDAYGDGRAAQRIVDRLDEQHAEVVSTGARS
jgi:UDP-N-acetylglucosamine 2-epimerase (non-hydrolysing)